MGSIKVFHIQILGLYFSCVFFYYFLCVPVFCFDFFVCVCIVFLGCVVFCCSFLLIFVINIILNFNRNRQNNITAKFQDASCPHTPCLFFRRQLHHRHSH